MLYYQDLLEENIESINDIGETIPISIIVDSIQKLQGISSILQSSHELQIIETQIDSIRDIDPAIINTAMDKLTRLNGYLSEQQSLEQIQNGINEISITIEQDQTVIHQLQHDLGEVEICPTCGNKVEEWV